MNVSVTVKSLVTIDGASVIVMTLGCSYIVDVDVNVSETVCTSVMMDTETEKLGSIPDDV